MDAGAVVANGAYVGGRGGRRRVALTYQPPRGFQRPVHAVHLVVEAARVAQVVAGAVAPPQRRVDGAAVDALAPLREEVHLDYGDTQLSHPTFDSRSPACRTRGIFTISADDIFKYLQSF